MNQTYCLFVFLFLLVGCAGNDASKVSTVPDTTSKVSQVPDNQVFLEGAYATSVADGSSVSNLFDQNPSTAWQTRAGAGPDEGVMLYFEQPLVVNGIDWVPTDQTTATGGIQVLVYLNGQEYANPLIPGTVLGIPPDKPLRSLYLRIVYDNVKGQTAIKNDDGDPITLSLFPSSASVGFKELRLLGTDGKAIPIAAPKQVKGTVTASTTLAPESAYSPANLFDARHEFVWVEGNAASAGEGETLTFQFDEPVRITAVKIWNGYQRSSEHYAANTRVRDIEFGPTNGTKRSYTLGDYPAGQKVELSPVAEGNTFTCTIKSIYPGKKYKDLAISDIVFYDGNQPFVLQTTLPSQYRLQLKNKTAASPWAALLDRRISNSTKMDAYSATKSLLLRSDGTFVMYNNTDLSETKEKTIADGNWEFTPDGQQVKIFGKMFDLRAASVYYQGSKDEAVTRIFNDVLTIKDRTISGSKFIETFWWK